MGACIPIIVAAGANIASSLISKGKKQEFRETPFQQQLGGFMGNLLQQGGTQMPPELFGQMQQAYQMPQSAPWAMGLLPGMFGGGFGMGGGMSPGMQGAGMGASGMGFPQQMPQQMPQMPMGGGFGMPQAGFGMNPFAM